jgi:hypothetical protein
MTEKLYWIVVDKDGKPIPECSVYREKKDARADRDHWQRAYGRLQIIELVDVGRRVL